PVRDDVGHRRIIGIDRLDDGEATGMSPLHFDRIARVVAVHGKGGDEDRAVDADPVHGRHHLVTGDVIGPIRDTVPGPFRGVRLIGVNLGIDDRHGPFLRSSRVHAGGRRIAGAVGRGKQAAWSDRPLTSIAAYGPIDAVCLRRNAPAVSSGSSRTRPSRLKGGTSSMWTVAGPGPSPTKSGCCSSDTAGIIPSPSAGSAR